MVLVGDRIGRALLHAPYTWLTAALCLLFIMATSLSGITKPVGEGSTPLAIVAAALAAIDGAMAAGALVLTAGVKMQVRPVEEPYLRATRGDGYTAFAGRTGRFLPLIGRLGERGPTSSELASRARP